MANVQWADRIGRRLKLRDLHVLSAVVQWGSMAKAAQHLAVSQPVVSAAVADLENAIGVRLLDRSRRGVEPTIYGRAILKHGMVAFDALKQGVKEIEFLADPPRANYASDVLNGFPQGCSQSSLISCCKNIRVLYSTLIRRLQARRIFASCASEVWTSHWVGYRRR